MKPQNAYKKTALAVIFLLFLNALPTFANANETFGLVNTITDPLNIRRQPNLNSPIITQVHKGSKLRILNNVGTTEWYQVQLTNGTVGYASSEHIVVLISQDSQKTSLGQSSEPMFNEIYGVVTTIKDPLNIRQQPNLDSAIITTVKKGSKLRILDNSKSQNWYKVELSNGTVGYANSQHITVLIP